MTNVMSNKRCYYYYYLLNLLQKQHNRRAIQQIHSHLTLTNTNATFITPTSKPNSIVLTLWNSILRSYSLSSSPQEAFFLFKQLQHINNNYSFDNFTYSFLIKASANLTRPLLGQQLHCLSTKSGFECDVYVQTALINMYVECGYLVDSGKVFDEMPERNFVTWNALITGFVKWGEVELARGLFDAMPVKDVVSWTGMIDGYTRKGRFNEALSLFRKMIGEDWLRPSEVTLLAVFPAIWNVGCLEFCQMVHAYGEKSGLNSFDVRVMNCLIDAYAKCGGIENAWGVFEDLGNERRNLVSWTSMISAFAMHGMGEEASGSFLLMENEGVKANRITFLSVLNACSHGGLVDEGLHFFRKMVDEYGIEPDIKHYGCLIDMLGRAGRLNEAEKMALGIPTDIGNVVVWRTLLGACSFYGDVEMGERVTRKIMEIERKYGGDYVLLSNIFASAGRHVDSENVRKVMDEQKAFKLPGLSSF